MKERSNSISSGKSIMHIRNILIWADRSIDFFISVIGVLPIQFKRPKLISFFLGANSPINNSSSSSNLSDDGTLHQAERERLPSFERIQQESIHHTIPETEIANQTTPPPATSSPTHHPVDTAPPAYPYDPSLASYQSFAEGFQHNTALLQPYYPTQFLSGYAPPAEGSAEPSTESSTLDLNMGHWPQTYSWSALSQQTY